MLAKQSALFLDCAPARLALFLHIAHFARHRVGRRARIGLGGRIGIRAHSPWFNYPGVVRLKTGSIMPSWPELPRTAFLRGEEKSTERAKQDHRLRGIAGQ